MIEDGFVVRPGLVIPRREIWFEFSHSSGPGGQNVNKVSSAVTLCFHPASSGALSEWEKGAVAAKLANRINRDGVLRVSSDEGRSQSGNRGRVVERFVALLQDVLKPVKRRRATRPSKGSVERRLLDKRMRSARKLGRRDMGDDRFGE